MSLLSVNLDFVAAMRELRHLSEPDPAQAAVLAELAGADGIAIQFRRDRRYVRDRDLYLLKGIVKTRLTIEMPPTDEFIEKALEVKPWMVTFAGDQADGGGPLSPIDFGNPAVDFAAIASRFGGAGVNVCFYVQPEPDELKGAAKAGAAAILLNCGGYSEARTLQDAQAELDRIDQAARAAAKMDLAVHGGRGIGYKNIAPLVELGNIDEFVIGSAICSRAILVGFNSAVREMIALVHVPVSRPA